MYRKFIIVGCAASLAGCMTWFNDADEDLYAGAQATAKPKVIVVEDSVSKTDSIKANPKFAQASAINPQEEIIHFNFDDSRIKSEFISVLKQQAEYLKNHPNAKLLLAGHTDERGSREYNVALGERRANSAYEMLRLFGVPAKQLRVLSYGQERPLEFGHDEAAWARNRRVELTFEAVA